MNDENSKHSTVRDMAGRENNCSTVQRLSNAPSELPLLQVAPATDESEAMLQTGSRDLQTNHDGLISPRFADLLELTPKQTDVIARTTLGGPDDVLEIHPLSPLQEGILFHHLLNPCDTYVLSMLFELESRAQIDPLVDAFNTVIKRHDILRSAIIWERVPSPVQIVYRRAQLAVEQIALHAGRDALDQLKERMRPGCERLELGKAPLMWLQIAADPHSARWYAILKVHHIVCDYQSLRIVVSEAFMCLEQRERELPAPVPFRAYVEQALRNSRSQEAEAFFRDKLATVDEPTAPFGRLDVHGDGRQIEEASLMMQAELAQRIRLQARCSGVSAARVFHAAWGLVVARTSGRDDVVYGTVILTAQQRSASAQRMLGLSVNTLPLRLRLDGLTARGLIQHTHEELTELLKHESAPLTLAQRSSGVGTTQPLFTSLLNFRHAAADEHSEGSGTAAVRVLRRGEAWTNYPITVTVDNLGDDFLVMAKADRSVGAQRTIDYLCTALVSLVHALEEDPATPALGLAVLPERERQQILHVFNKTPTAYPENELIHELFEAQVRRTPQAVAVVDEQRSLSYAELNARSNQLAHYLRSLGVGPRELVGLCLERSIELLVGLLGVLKVGGAYIPLDPEFPSERLRHIVQESSPRAIVTQPSLTHILSDLAVQIIVRDAPDAEIVESDVRDLGLSRSELNSSDLAYVIYTSGSTGKPKGVMVEHRNVISLWQGLEHIYRRSPECRRVGVNASFTFDASVKQFVQLLSGRTIVLVPQQVRLDSKAFLDFVDEHRIDGIDCTPLQLKSWIEAGMLDRESRHRLRVVLIGGEQIDQPLWATLARCAQTQFYNVYGPTESTVDATFARLNGDRTTPHIGAPMENRTLYLLDEHRRLVPIGVSGEIYIGGAGVARGYLNRPVLTAERFLKDPFISDPQARIYKSGDLGRWRTDGLIEYLGRNDQQVKIRGFRIELPEIEAQLSGHAQVGEAVVLAREDVPGQKSLVAYVAPRNATSPPRIEELRSHLKTVLPEYMIPAAFVMMGRLPLSPNGKLDRRALPAPDLGAFATCEYEAPQAPVEQALAAIWCDVLGVERVGRQHNFFELGGDSLLLMRLVSRASAELSVQLDVQSLLKATCLWEMAALVSVSRAKGSAERSSAAKEDIAFLRKSESALERPIPKRESCSPIPLTAMQRFWVRWEGKAGRRVIRGPTSVTRITGPLDLDLFRTSLTFLGERHEMLRTRFIEQAGTYWHQVDTTFRCQLDVVDLTQSLAKDVEVHSIVKIFFEEEVDISVGPLFALKLVRLSDREHVMIIGLDHMICDGVSSGILLSELSTAYNDLARGALPSLPELPIQFGDYAVWEQETHAIWHHAHGKYWVNRLAGAPRPRIPLSDGPREKSDPASVDVYFEFDETLSAELRLIARREKVLLAMVMLTVYVIVMRRWCDQEDLMVMFQSDGRYRPELEKVIGFVTTVLLLRIEVHKSDTFRDLLKRVNEEFCAACEHSGPVRLSDGPEGQTNSVRYDTEVAFQWSPLRGERFMIDAAKIESGKFIRFDPYPYKRETGVLEKFGFYCFDGINGIYCYVTYRTDIFTKGTIDRFWHNLQRVSEAFARHPDATMSMI